MLISSSPAATPSPDAALTPLSSRLSSPSAPLQDPTESVVAPRPGTPELPRQVAASTRAATMAYQQQREFEFELTTRDGDRVKIRAFGGESGSLSVAQQHYAAPGVEQTQISMAAQQGSRSEFRFEVDGELDADELAAINDLLAQVGQVSEQFFAGEPLAAFEQLQSLGFDTAEIAGFSLELEQRTTVAVSYREAALAQYRDIAGQSDQLPGLGLGRYIDGLGQALERAEVLDDPRQQLETLVATLIEARAAELAEDGHDDDHGEGDSLLQRAEAMNRDLLDWLEATHESTERD